MIVIKKIEVELTQMLDDFALEDLKSRFIDFDNLINEFQEQEIEFDDISKIYFLVLNYGYINNFEIDKQYEKQFAKDVLICPYRFKCLTWAGKVFLRELLAREMGFFNISKIFNFSRNTMVREVKKGIGENQSPVISYREFNPELAEYREFCKTLDWIDVSKEQALDYIENYLKE